MVTHYHGEHEIEWTDGEWKRLQQVLKNKKEDSTKVSFFVRQDVKKAAMEYAAAQGMSFSAFIRGIVEGVIENRGCADNSTGG